MFLLYLASLASLQSTLCSTVSLLQTQQAINVNNNCLPVSVFGTLQGHPWEGPLGFRLSGKAGLDVSW